MKVFRGEEGEVLVFFSGLRFSKERLATPRRPTPPPESRLLELFSCWRNVGLCVRWAGAVRMWGLYLLCC